MTLEDASPADLPAIVALMNRAYRPAPGQGGWATEADYIDGDRTTLALLRADLAAAPDAHLLVAHDAHGAPDRCVWLAPHGDSVWYLGSLAIDPALQGGGAGRAMLAACEGWIAVRGGRRVRMTVVNVRDALIAWYERRGYARTGETEPWPYGDDRYGVPRRDDLCFVVLEKLLAPAR
jgi:ribosomal protein S18 acetylase RimI-like enzyme